MECSDKIPPTATMCSVRNSRYFQKILDSIVPSNYWFLWISFSFSFSFQDNFKEKDPSSCFICPRYGSFQLLTHSVGEFWVCQFSSMSTYFFFKTPHFKGSLGFLRVHLFGVPTFTSICSNWENFCMNCSISNPLIHMWFYDAVGDVWIMMKFICSVTYKMVTRSSVT